jgi:hypothetical protein
LANGFGINQWTTISKEQDVIIYDRDLSPIVIDEKNCKYIPQYVIVSSIEIKSNLTKTELKKSILNCISIKNYALMGSLNLLSRLNLQYFMLFFAMILL